MVIAMNEADVKPHDPRLIDYALLSRAITLYIAKGYEYVDVPWYVPKSINMLTCPYEAVGDMSQIAGTNDWLVGSAEQSFLHMEFNGKLPPGKYVACTPCFRIENLDDGLHHPTFMKVELYRTDRTDAEAQYEMIGNAEYVFHKLIGANPAHKLSRELTPLCIDIMLNGIEIGSYGIRRIGAFSWVYGTGIALPRFTQAMANANHV